MFNKSAKGIKDFISFIGWIKNAKFQAFQLWANGKKNYSDNPNTKDPFMRESPYILNNSKYTELVLKNGILPPTWIWNTMHVYMILMKQIYGTYSINAPRLN